MDYYFFSSLQKTIPMLHNIYKKKRFNAINLCDYFNQFLFSEKGECIPHRTDDAFLLRFLRAKRFVVRHAHRMVCYN